MEATSPAEGQTPVPLPSAEESPPGKGGPEETEVLIEVTEIRRRIADWRYTGYIGTEKGTAGLLQRVRHPERRLTVVAGQKLEGVSIEEVRPERLVVSFEGDREEIPLSSGPAFDLSDILIPTELAEDPGTLAEVVYAQTLGRYAAEQPEVEVEGDDESSEMQGEMMEAVSERNSWERAFLGESVDSWVDRLAESLPSGEEENLEVSEPNPEDYPLTEERRLQLLGFHPDRGN